MKCTIKKLLQAFIYTFTSEFHSPERRDGKNRPPKLAERGGGICGNELARGRRGQKIAVQASWLWNIGVQGRASETVDVRFNQIALWQNWQMEKAI